MAILLNLVKLFTEKTRVWGRCPPPHAWSKTVGGGGGGRPSLFCPRQFHDSQLLTILGYGFRGLHNP